MVDFMVQVGKYTIHWMSGYRNWRCDASFISVGMKGEHGCVLTCLGEFQTHTKHTSTIRRLGISSARMMELFSCQILSSIHVWYIYLHLVDFYGKCRYCKYTMHGSYGFFMIHSYRTQFECIPVLRSWWNMKITLQHNKSVQTLLIDDDTGDSPQGYGTNLNVKPTFSKHQKKKTL